MKLDGGRFTDKGLRVLTGLTALRSLSLQDCHNITDEGLKILVEPLSRHSLAQVDVKGCRRLTALSLVGLNLDAHTLTQKLPIVSKVYRECGLYGLLLNLYIHVEHSVGSLLRGSAFVAGCEYGRGLLQYIWLAIS